MKNQILKNYNFEKMVKKDWETLIASGDVNFQDEAGRTPLFYACESGNVELAQQLIKARFLIEVKCLLGQRPLHRAFNKEIATLLIKNGADVNIRDDGYQTPLHTAWNKEVVQVLLEAGAEVNAIDRSGNTPLHLVNSLEITILLINYGADVNIVNQDDNTPDEEILENIAFSFEEVKSITEVINTQQEKIHLNKKLLQGKPKMKDIRL